jgi:hypothetical protein
VTSGTSPPLPHSTHNFCSHRHFQAGDTERLSLYMYPRPRSRSLVIRSASSVSLRIVALPAADAASRVNGERSSRLHECGFGLVHPARFKNISSYSEIWPRVSSVVGSTPLQTSQSVRQLPRRGPAVLRASTATTRASVVPASPSVTVSVRRAKTLTGAVPKARVCPGSPRCLFTESFPPGLPEPRKIAPTCTALDTPVPDTEQGARCTEHVAAFLCHERDHRAQRSICARMRITTHHIQCSWAALSGSQPTPDFHVNDQAGNAFSARWRSYQGRRRILCLWGVNSRRRMPSYVP